MNSIRFISRVFEKAVASDVRKLIVENVCVVRYQMDKFVDWIADVTIAENLVWISAAETYSNK